MCDILLSVILLGKSFGGWYLCVPAAPDGSLLLYIWPEQEATAGPHPPHSSSKAKPRRRDYKGYSDSDMEMALELIQQGFSMRQSAKRAGVPLTTVHDRLVRQKLGYNKSFALRKKLA